MMDNFWLLIFCMSGITFFCRFLFLSKKLPFELNQKTKLALSYTAPSVLTAMWVPIIFLSYQHIEQSFFTSPFLIAGLLSILLSLKFKSTLLIVMVSMTLFITLQLTY